MSHPTRHLGHAAQLFEQWASALEDTGNNKTTPTMMVAAEEDFTMTIIYSGIKMKKDELVYDAPQSNTNLYLGLGELLLLH